MSNIIYCPEGSAGEYTLESVGAYNGTVKSGYAANLYVGCPGRCSYCYRDHGITRAVIGGSQVRLKKTAGADEEDAYRNFYAEISQKKAKIGNSYLFFTFTSDSGAPETVELTWRCIKYAVENGVHCKTLTKFATWSKHPIVQEVLSTHPNMLKVGFTLTGCDNHESGAAPNLVRIQTMDYVKKTFGVPTWASCEPILDPNATLQMIEECEKRHCCDEYKIGVLTGVHKEYGPSDILTLKNIVDGMNLKVYWKRSLVEFVQKV